MGSTSAYIRKPSEVIRLQKPPSAVFNLIQVGEVVGGFSQKFYSDWEQPITDQFTNRIYLWLDEEGFERAFSGETFKEIQLLPHTYVDIPLCDGAWELINDIVPILDGASFRDNTTYVSRGNGKAWLWINGALTKVSKPLYLECYLENVTLQAGVDNIFDINNFVWVLNNELKTTLTEPIYLPSLLNTSNFAVLDATNGSSIDTESYYVNRDNISNIQTEINVRVQTETVAHIYYKGYVSNCEDFTFNVV